MPKIVLTIKFYVNVPLTTTTFLLVSFLSVCVQVIYHVRHVVKYVYEISSN